MIKTLMYIIHLIAQPVYAGGFFGVRQAESGKWRSDLRVNGKRIYLGVYLSAEEAARAYDIEAAKHCKPVNFSLEANMKSSSVVESYQEDLGLLG